VFVDAGGEHVARTFEAQKGASFTSTTDTLTTEKSFKLQD
jgi:hypothetical protein